MNDTKLTIIARIHNDFSEKFGVPRQSGLTNIRSKIVFEPEFRVAEALRGLDEFSHIWILWLFSECLDAKWSPTVRPPRLGGNVRKGVFATRSPFRPNSIGLSCVKFEKIEKTAEGDVIWVTGADLMDGTPIIDIKPYIPYADCVLGASGGFAVAEKISKEVVFLNGCDKIIPKEKLRDLTEILSQDPRPAYHDAPERVYKFDFGGYSVAFSVEGEILSVSEIKKL